MPAQTEMMDAINDLRARVEAVHTEQQVSNHRLGVLHEETSKMRRTISGDSEPERSMVHRLMRVEGTVEEIQAERGRIKGWAWGAISSALAAVASVVWAKLSK